MQYIETILQMQVLLNFEDEIEETLDLDAIQTLCGNLMEFVAEKRHSKIDKVAQEIVEVFTSGGERL